nr:FeoA family protein [uncultured Akkermansia sp.]
MNQLTEGEAARIESLRMEGRLRRRLMDIGMIPGTRVECLERGPFGDPVAFLVRGTVMALRSSDLELITVRSA